jgi:hypothetical protein
LVTLRSSGGPASDAKAGCANYGAVLIWRARAAWAHDWISDPNLLPMFEALPGASFIVNGATRVKNSALASAGAELSASHRCGGHLRKPRPLKIQRKNSGSGNKCLRAIGATTRSLRNWVRSAKNLI